MQPPGIPGPQVGVGNDAVADWWLGRAGAVLGEVAAALTPATTTQKAKTRMASFMVGYLWWLRMDRRHPFPMLKS
jgi:hypothetical protein